MKLTSKRALPVWVAAVLLAGSSHVFAHGNVTPQAVDVTGLEALGEGWREENPYVGNEAAIKIGAAAAEWSAQEKALIAAVDDLNRDHFVSNASWAELLKHYSERQCMDLVFTVGQYTQVSMILNSFGVQLDQGQTLDPELKAF